MKKVKQKSKDRILWGLLPRESLLLMLGITLTALLLAERLF